MVLYVCAVIAVFVFGRALFYPAMFWIVMWSMRQKNMVADEEIARRSASGFSVAFVLVVSVTMTLGYFRLWPR